MQGPKRPPTHSGRGALFFFCMAKGCIDPATAELRLDRSGAFQAFDPVMVLR